MILSCNRYYQCICVVLELDDFFKLGAQLKWNSSLFEYKIQKGQDKFMTVY